MKRKNVIKIVIIAVAISLGLAFVINLLFKIHSVGLLSAEWNAGDALNYVAAIASFIGTVVLGYVAYSQNEMLMRQNNKLQDLEENSYIVNNNSMIIIEEIRISECDKFSRIAIHKDGIVKFGMEFVIDRQKKKKFEEAIKKSACNLVVEIMFQIIANKNVATRCKCRAYLHSEQTGNDITWKSENPMVFYYGNFMVKEYEIAGEKKC